MPTPAPGLLDAARFWLKLGFISFGGPAGQIAIMHQELVERRRWISERRFLHALNYCMLLPGPEAQQLATYIGWLLHGVRGGIVAGALFVLPSLFILIGLSWIYLTWGHTEPVTAIFQGIKPAVVAIVLFAAWRIGQRALRNGLLWLVAAAAFIAIFVLHIPFPAIILGAGVIGMVGGHWLPYRFSTAGSHQSVTQAAHPPAVIDDHTACPAHAKFAWSRFVICLAAGFGLWLAVFGVLLALYGWQGVLTQMAWFFTKAALLTFGGAYAVLPYVYQGAVEQHAWLTATQMIDGLALGETTPGPLIMVVAFVAFVGGWTVSLFGDTQLFMAGCAAAVVVTYFTFLPSFLFILLGGPLIESTHGDLKFTAPLTAITAAVVGVILNLALFFAWHVFWPAGFDGDFAWRFALMGAIAFVAMWRYGLGVIPVITACALVGLGLHLIS